MKKSNLAFGSKNYRLMLIGLGVLILGFVLMSLDTEEFGFGLMGLTIGPLTVLAGFGIQFAAIMIHDEVPELESFLKIIPSGLPELEGKVEAPVAAKTSNVRSTKVAKTTATTSNVKTAAASNKPKRKPAGAKKRKRKSSR